MVQSKLHFLSHLMLVLILISRFSYRWIEAAEKAAVNHNPSSNNSSYNSKSLPRDAKRKEPLGQANASTYESIRHRNG
jgi:partitioning defective protein 3